MSIGGQPPQWLFRSVYDSGVYRIHRMDVETYTEDVVLGDGATSYRDPDYSAVLDRLVFVSNESGSDEVWIANGDGSDKTQVTVGFGKSNHGIKARAPKLCPMVRPLFLKVMPMISWPWKTGFKLIICTTWLIITEPTFPKLRCPTAPKRTS